ncbi:hypothetical protein G3M48_003100 [Beauveria asiatica]|uniref:Uncharacterized protein n=1 Tax=Beauveria asiatica TaxID=1069075 RepID=A0AAW0S7H1_9HYPO
MYQAYVASESGDSCQRSGDSPRSEPADYWDKEEQDHWPDDSSGAISPDDSAFVRQRQQTSPPPVRYYSSPPRHQRRSKPPSSVLSDDFLRPTRPQGLPFSTWPSGVLWAWWAGASCGEAVCSSPPSIHASTGTFGRAWGRILRPRLYADFRIQSTFAVQSDAYAIFWEFSPVFSVAGEEDDVVQLKAVWVSGPSRIDPESSRKSEEDQSGQEVRVEKPDDEASRPHESKARGQSKVPFTNAIITKLPFFTWKTSLCDAKDDSIKGTVINRLLENANENLVAREVVGKLYDKAYVHVLAPQF